MSAGVGVEESVPGIDLSRLTTWLRTDLPALKPPFNFDARRAAGFDEDELQALREAAAPDLH